MSKKAKFLEMRSLGMSYANIANDLKVSRQTLFNWAKELQTELSNIDSARRLEIIEAIKIAKDYRLQATGKLYEKIAEEICSRDLRTEKTGDLFKVLSQLETQIEDECRAITFRKPAMVAPFPEDFETWRP